MYLSDGAVCQRRSRQVACPEKVACSPFACKTATHISWTYDSWDPVDSVVVEVKESFTGPKISQGDAKDRRHVWRMSKVEGVHEKRYRASSVCTSLSRAPIAHCPAGIQFELKSGVATIRFTEIRRRIR